MNLRQRFSIMVNTVTDNLVHVLLPTGAKLCPLQSLPCIASPQSLQLAEQQRQIAKEMPLSDRCMHLPHCLGYQMSMHTCIFCFAMNLASYIKSWCFELKLNRLRLESVRKHSDVFSPFVSIVLCTMKCYNTFTSILFTHTICKDRVSSYLKGMICLQDMPFVLKLQTK